ncbi:MAG: DUF4191 domain-containing protein [Actinomycetota bacterium]|nr:DUF4191 domain-containing protein [Actinomycetota bacterium]
MALGRRKPPATGKPPAKPSAGKQPAARAPRKAGPSRRERAGQVRQAFVLTRKSDPRLPVFLAAGFLAPFMLLLLVGFAIGHPVYLGIVGALFGFVGLMAVFGRRVQKTAYAQVEGQLGAAAAVLERMRGDWRVTPAVGFTREQDLLHRVVGRPGVVLVAEGSPSRARGLIITEKKRLSRSIGTTPVYDLIVGDGDGTIPLRGLEKHFLKLPRNIKPKEVNELDRRLKALAGPSLPIPKGPMPRGGRVPRGKVR